MFMLVFALATFLRFTVYVKNYRSEFDTTSHRLLLASMIATVFMIFLTHALRRQRATVRSWNKRLNSLLFKICSPKSFAVIYYSAQNEVSTGCFAITESRKIIQEKFDSKIDGLRTSRWLVLEVMDQTKAKTPFNMSCLGRIDYALGAVFILTGMLVSFHETGNLVLLSATLKTIR